MNTTVLHRPIGQRSLSARIWAVVSAFMTKDRRTRYPAGEKRTFRSVKVRLVEVDGQPCAREGAVWPFGF